MRKDFTVHYVLCRPSLPFFISRFFRLSSMYGGSLMACKCCFPSGLVAYSRMLLILMFSWLSGLLCGAFCYLKSPPEIVSLMHRAVACSASIVGLLNAALIPFLLSVLFLAFSTPWMVVGICFAKTFLFSFVSLGILMSFGSGGWLLRFFLLFGDCAAMPLLYWYWSRYICTSIGLRWIAVSAAFLLVLLLITSLDYRVFAPLVCLIDSMKG